MNKAKAMRWVKALRSGKYKQGRRKLLNNQGEYCCLGVLADITKDIPKNALLNTKNLWGITDLCGLTDPLGGCIDCDSIKLANGVEYRHLAAANDDGVSFKRIATWIEKNYKLL